MDDSSLTNNKIWKTQSKKLLGCQNYWFQGEADLESSFEIRETFPLRSSIEQANGDGVT
jgi:hypothetical protein